MPEGHGKGRSGPRDGLEFAAQPGAYRVRDAASIAVYGLHRGLDLIDGVGKDEFAAAHDPVPAGARPDPMARGLTGDPFDDPSRPLILTVASDCADLPARVLRDLVSLSMYPGIEVSLCPGVPDLGYERCLRLDWTDDQFSINVTQAGSAGRGRSDAFATFDGRAPTDLRTALDHASAFPQPELVARAGDIFDAPQDRAQVVASEAIAHKVLGNDYIVSPILARGRRIRHAGWPNELGACTPNEAFALAGLKSRMYRAVPLLAEPNASVMESTALYRDLAVTRLAPRLSRAIGSALGPDSSTEEAASSDRLLAVRGRLADLLIARDSVLRLARRDALGPNWLRPFDQGPVSGALGNELTAHMVYDTMAGLHALTAIADNLTWIVRRRSSEDLPDDDRSSSFAQIMTSDNRMSASLRDMVDSLQKWPAFTTVLALLRLRNAFAHRDGVSYGILSTQTMTIPPTRQVAAMWFEPTAIGRPVRLASGEVDLFAAIADHATFVGDGLFVAFTFPAFLAAVVRAAFGLTNAMLCRPAWSSPRAWLFDAQARENRLTTRRLWRSTLQRRLLGLSRGEVGVE